MICFAARILLIVLMCWILGAGYFFGFECLGCCFDLLCCWSCCCLLLLAVAVAFGSICLCFSACGLGGLYWLFGLWFGFDVC